MSFSIIPIMLVLVCAHNLTALSSIVTLAIAVVVCVVVGGRSDLRRTATRLALCVGAVAVVLSPLILAEFRFNRYYAPASKATQGPFMASRNFVSPGDYFWDSQFRWLTDYVRRTPFHPNTLAVQIDFAIWVPIALGVVLACVAVVRRRHLNHGPSPNVMWFVFGALAIYMFLQLSVSKPIYKIVRPLELLQFPWRLMAFITPLGILAVVLLADIVSPRIDRMSPIAMPVLSLAWLASMITLGPLLATFHNYGFLPNKILVAPRYQTFGQPPLLYAAEYLPQIGEEASFVTLQRYEELLTTHRLAEPLPATGANPMPSARCSVSEPAKTNFESLQFRLTVTCNRPTRLALPISYNAFTTITETNSKGQAVPVPYRHVANDPRIVVQVTSTRPQHLVIHLPTFWKVVF